MPPPPRRRRPVQPATRVRLPRAARPRGESASAEVPELTPAGPANAGTGQDSPGTGQDSNAATATPAQSRQTTETEAGRAPAGEAARASVLTDEPAGQTEPAGGDEERADAAGTAVPAGDEDTGGETAGEHVREPLLLPVCLGVVAVALGGLAVWFGLKPGGSTAGTGFGAGTGNAAVVDRAATAQVNRQIDNAVDTIFSYNYADTARTQNAAKTLLTGPARAEYATLFKVVQQQAPKEKLVLTTTVTNSGVEMLNGDTARLLIFANQKDTGAAKGSTTEAGAMFAVTAVKQHGQWKIENINTFSAPG
jgi:Mce-associated membrane protein